MAEAASLRPVTAGARFTAKSVHVGFVMDDVAQRQVYLRVLRLSLSVSFHKCFKIRDDIILETDSIIK
jgi:hypothetical protein